MIYDVFCGTGNFQVELLSEVVIPRKRMQRPCKSGSPGIKEEDLDIEPFETGSAN